MTTSPHFTYVATLFTAEGVRHEMGDVVGRHVEQLQATIAAERVERQRLDLVGPEVESAQTRQTRHDVGRDRRQPVGVQPKLLEAVEGAAGEQQARPVAETIVLQHQSDQRGQVVPRPRVDRGQPVDIQREIDEVREPVEHAVAELRQPVVVQL